MDAEEKGEDGDKKPTSVGLKAAFNKTEGEGSKEDKDDLVEIEGKDEDVAAEGEEGKTSSDPNESKTKLDTRATTEDTEKKEQEKVKRPDYEMLDELTSFLYSDEDPLPILCGYFFKIME